MKWLCLDKDDQEAGYVGDTPEEALTNYVNCAAGFSCFDRPIYPLVNANVRLNVRKMVNMHQSSDLPKGFLIGGINPEYFDSSSEK